ncbi:glucose-6-phosphate isomerase [Planctomycetales bacterium ZRK34]|nr:glucose-6-phosphate isomerase [Planctomycetales bacterium ZRK34]
MSFDPQLDVTPTTAPLGFGFGDSCFGPQVEYRGLDSIRKSLLDPECDGPDPVYAIAMDVGRAQDRDKLLDRNLLFGVVTYAAGRLGTEPVRSQGHVHKPSPRNGWSTPEVYEIWRGRAVILMQESDGDAPGRCFAVQAGPGEVVIVPPGWAHATISADPNQPLSFGAWCDRNYGFIYDGVRAHGGLAWFALLDEAGKLRWRRNPTYQNCELTIKSPQDYRELGLEPGVPIYRQFERDLDRFLFVAEPQRCATYWASFVP